MILLRFTSGFHMHHSHKHPPINTNRNKNKSIYTNTQKNHNSSLTQLLYYSPYPYNIICLHNPRCFSQCLLSTQGFTTATARQSFKQVNVVYVVYTTLTETRSHKTLQCLLTSSSDHPRWKDKEH